ncbi:MAG: ribosomal-protein-alanine N-acetyltransferase [SAR202 cluster bacterium Casp-Chloro-G4]|nr:ribosomal protein S18-alanine N-acetyltransferase [Chloroflexota bacterium]MDA1228243.1 ribosomal protein S18-alanine N-acetyltransferase [Chloroflexota bacterium]PKB61346.1 MAG: ribosomal-protein-alanine N-acetyltransferase [SAR202 cluster bacterium Casp-Chloro-G4]
MSAIGEIPHGKIMPFALRPLEEIDTTQAAEIERDAFPTLFPPTPFRRELRNRMAQYLVAWRRDDLNPSNRVTSAAGDVEAPPGSPLSISRLLDNARGFLAKRNTTWVQGEQYVAGFLGTWYMVDEAHIVSVGVRTEHRGNGIGELLLIGGIEQATNRGSAVVTLEVRASNDVAQNLYKKYGFTERGVRKAYYTDNREDALIMTTDEIQSQEFRDRFQFLSAAHQGRWGFSDRLLV